MSNALLDQALDLATKGFRVLPLKPGSRVPKGVKGWQQKATTDPKTIKSWWKRLPQANVGLLTGGDFMVLDIDTKKGKKGLQSLKELQAAHGLPKTYTVKTPSGGLHLYYNHPTPGQPIKNRVDMVLPCLSAPKSGVDIRADEGQVVAPGMRVDDFPENPYTVVFDIPMADLPDSLIDQLPYREQDHGTQTSQSTDKAPPTSTGELRGDGDGDGEAASSGRGSPAPAKHAGHAGTDQPRQTTGESNLLGTFHNLPVYARSDPNGSGTALARSSPAGLVTGEDPSEYSTIPDSIPAGGRDDALFRFMCSWRERGYPLAHAEVLANELHSRLEQPQGDEISLSTIILKLHRTYKTYVPSAQDEAELQSITPSNPVTDPITSAEDWVSRPTPAEQATITEFSADAFADIVEVPPEGVLDTVKAALDRFVFCIEGNTVIDTTKHPAYATVKMDAFKSAYGNITLKTSSRENAKSKPLPEIWLKHKNRQTVDDYGYRPNGAKVYTHLGTKFYNKWAPSEVAEEMRNESSNGSGNGTSDSGAVSLGATGDVENALKPFWDHLDFLFGDDEKEKQAFWNWLAFSIRYPERRVAHGVLIVSEPGVGKSWFYKLLQKLAGVFDVNTAGNNELNSDFNGWVFGCSFVVIHELMTGSKRHMMQQLLSLVTEERILINEKHKQPRMRDIFANFLCFSNHSNAAALGIKDRRFLVYQSAAHKADLSYYKKLFGWLETDGPLHLLQYVHSMDLSGFNPGEAPMDTAAKRAMTHANMDLVEQAIVEAIEDRIGPFTFDVTSAEAVEKWLETRMELGYKDRHRIRVVLAGLSPPLRQGRYRFPSDAKQHRLRAVRDGSLWAKADTLTVLDEFEKSLEATSAPVTKLEAVR